MGKKIKESSTVAGAVAPVAQSMHTDKRSVVGQGIYGKTKGGNLLTGKKSSKKFANSIAEAQTTQEGILDIFKGTDNKKPKRVAVSTDDEAGKISFSDLGKNAIFDPNDKRITDDQRMFYEFMLSQKNKADSTDFINAIQHYIRKYKDAARKEGGSNPHNSGRLKVLNYFERQLEKMPIKESDISEEILAKRLAHDFKTFKHPKDREISQRSKDRDILPKQELDEYSWGEFKQDAADTGRGVYQGVTFGTGENITAAAKSAFGPETYKQELEKQKAANQAAKERSPYLYGGGEIAGSLLTPVPGGAVASGLIKGTTTAAKVARPAAAIATNLATSYAVDKAKQAHEKSVLDKPDSAPTTPAPASTPPKPSQPTSQTAAAPSNFKQAFAAARRGGAGTFTYNGKEYNTQLAEQALTKMKKIKPTIKQDKLSPHEKFKGSVKRAGYDMDAGANRLLKLLDKQARERADRDSEGVNEWVSRREEFNPQPAVSTFESADNTVKTFRVSLVDRLTDEPKTVTVKASSGEEAEAKAEKQHSGYDVRGSRKISEGAKVDRMVKHIEKSELATGKDKKEAENIAWATANKRGYLDNKNKKKHVAEGRVKDLAMAIDELTHDGKTPGQIAKELDVPLMIVLKFKAEMDQMDKPVVAKGQMEAANPAQQAAIAINMKKHHQKPKNEGSFDSAEYDDESGMAHNQLENIARAVHGLADTIDEGDNLPEWVQKKLTLAEENLITIWNYLQSEKSDEIMEQGVAEGTGQRVKIISGLDMYIGKTGTLGKMQPQHAKEHPGHVLVNLDHGAGSVILPKSAVKIQGVAEGKADPTGSWVVYDGGKVKRFKTRDGAKAYAEKNGGKVASSEFYADNIQGKQGVAEGSHNIEVGDKITWWYNKFHPNYEGVVRKLEGNSIIVYAPSSGEMYRLSKDDIRSHEKKGVAEGLTEGTKTLLKRGTYDWGSGEAEVQLYSDNDYKHYVVVLKDANGKNLGTIYNGDSRSGALKKFNWWKGEDLPLNQQGVAEGTDERKVNRNEDRIFYAVQDTNGKYHVYSVLSTIPHPEDFNYNNRRGPTKWHEGPFTDVDDAHRAVFAHKEKLDEFEAGGNFKPPKTPKGKGRGPWDDDDRSKIVLAVGQLLDGGNKVDWLVPGQMGHVVGTRDEGVSLKRLDKPHSKITYFLPISSDARDHRYQIKMKGPKHYVVVGADDDDPLEEGWKSKVAGTALALGALGGIGKVIQDNPNVTINDVTYAKATTMPNRELAKDLKVQTDEQGNKIYTFYYKGKHGYLRPYYYPVEKEDKHKITKIKGKEYLQHELPNNKDDVKLTTDDNGNKVYAWVQKSGMKPQYTYYWFAPAEKVNEQGVAEAQQCPECGGAAYDNEMIAEEKDACYSKVKSRYKVWPSAYASGALVKCRKVGAKNWGNKSKKK